MLVSWLTTLEQELLPQKSWGGPRKSNLWCVWVESVHSILTYCPLCLLACRAATKVLHSGRFWAVFWTSPRVRFIDFIPSSTVRRQVVLGGPLFLLPSGVQWRATLGMLSCSLLKTCPIQFQRCFVIMLSMLSCWHLVNRSSFVQKIWHILRLLVWKTDSCHMSLSVILQHSAPWRVDRTQLWQLLIYY